MFNHQFIDDACLNNMYDLSGYIPTETQISLVSAGGSTPIKRIQIIAPSGPGVRGQKTNKRVQTTSIIDQMSPASTRGRSQRSKNSGPPKRTKRAATTKPKRTKRAATTKPKREGKKKKKVVSKKRTAGSRKPVTFSKNRVNILFASGKKKTVASSSLLKRIAPATIIKAALLVTRKKRKN